MKVTVTGGTISPAEQDAYIARAYQKYPHNTIEELENRLPWSAPYSSMHIHQYFASGMIKVW